MIADKTEESPINPLFQITPIKNNFRDFTYTVNINTTLSELRDSKNNPESNIWAPLN